MTRDDSGSRDPCPLDAAVAAASTSLERQGIPAPRALFLLGTGAGLLPLRLKRVARTSLAAIEGTPAAWRRATLSAGSLAGVEAWILEDAPGPPERGALPDPDEAPWVRGFPCWLAAAAGAAVVVHTSAGASLREDLGPGTFALVSDHLNLSGRTPLLGLSSSALGPLFPDTSRLHHGELRARALEIALSLGLPAREAIAACTTGPALETQAERRFFARAGADVAVQGLEGPLLAAAHAGLAALAVVCVTDRGDEGVDLAAVVATAEHMAAGLEDLLTELAPDVARAAAGLEVEA